MIEISVMVVELEVKKELGWCARAGASLGSPTRRDQRRWRPLASVGEEERDSD